MKNRAGARLVLSLSLLSAASALEAQTASLVADLGQVTEPPESSSQLEGLFAWKDKVFMTAFERSSGGELWVSDGEGHGTRQLADFCQGRCGSNPRVLGATSSAAFGVTNFRIDFDNIILLWRSNGTRQGTFLLPTAADPVTVADFEVPAWAFLGNVLYFSGCNVAEGCGLWRSDGTAAGTRTVRSFGSLFDAQKLTVAGNRLFFLNGQTLWVTDGSPAGTRATVGLPNPQLLTAFGNRVVFVGGPFPGEQLWSSDGTTAGTRPLTSFAAASPFQQTLFLKPLGGKVYFVADDLVHGEEIWATDGTPTGTRQVTEIGFHDPFLGAGLRSTSLDLLGNRLIFWADDGIHGTQLWATTGTPQGTAPVCPRCAFTQGQTPLVKVGSRLVFTGSDAAHGAEAWATDGTAAGTKLLKEACPGPCDGARSEPQSLLGSAFFAASPPAGSALWRTDGTAQGTRQFAVPGPFMPDPPFGFPRRFLAASGSTVFFAADGADDYGVELWRSNGTPAGTRLVTDLSQGNGASTFEAITAAGRNAFFSTCTPNEGFHVGLTAGTPETTQRVRHLAGCSFAFPFPLAAVADARLYVTGSPFEGLRQLWRMDPDGTLVRLLETPEGDLIGGLVPLANRAYFFVFSFSPARLELWGSDGTVQGTAKVVDLPAHLRGPAFTTVVGAEIWFVVDDFDQQGGGEIWRTNGSAAGTRQAVDLGNKRLPADPGLTQVGSSYFFVRPEDDGPSQLWRTDGTPGATAIVYSFDSPALFGTADPADLTAFQGSLYFSARTSAGKIGLWRSDGTTAGTVMIKDFVDRSDFLRDLTIPFGLAAVGPWLVFAADDGAHGDALWRSDGTAAGTTLLRDVTPFFPSEIGLPTRRFTAAGGRLYFAADDGVHGFELWRTDGTPAGTRMVQDIAPEAASSFPERLTAAEDRLFFTADDGAAGRELWVLPLTGPPCQPTTTALCLAGGRYEVKVAWRDFTGRTGTGRASPLTPDTGTFWFFDPANVETVVKVLDGTGVNGHVWVFYGALSNVEYTVTVTDTATGIARRYFNPMGNFASVGDTQGFGPLGAFASQTVAPHSAPLLVSERFDATKATATCVPAAGRLCLNGGRFAVEADWEDFTDRTGTGTAVGLTGDTGYFWFFDAANVEVVLKVLDATAVNGRFWVFYGALSNVEYTLTVTDTVTGKVKTYGNPKGRFGSVGDTEAF